MTLDYLFHYAVAGGFLFDLEGPLAGGVVLEFDAGLEGEQGGGG